MRKALKLMTIIIIILGITILILNFISVDSMADFPNPNPGGGDYQGTLQPDGCYGEPLNC